MSPLCHTAGCENYREGNTPYCASCNHRQRKEAKTLNTPVKLNAKIKKVSDKRAGELARYSRLKAQYIAIHQICEVVGCNKQAVDIHHQKGRENDLLMDTNYWMAICRDHHVYYTEHSKEAIEQGISHLRTAK